MNREVHVRFCERFGGETPPYLLDNILNFFQFSIESAFPLSVPLLSFFDLQLLISVLQLSFFVHLLLLFALELKFLVFRSCRFHFLSLEILQEEIEILR